MDNTDKIPEVTQAPVDSLLRCLAFLSRYYSKPFSASAVIAGIPLVQNRLTPKLFIQAAERIGFNATLIKQPLKNIQSSSLPMVLILSSKKAIVLIAWKDNDKALLFNPDREDPDQEVTRELLEKHYSGHAILISPALVEDTHTHQQEIKQPLNWFWQVMKRAWAAYSEIFIASFLINLFALAVPLFIMNVYDRVVPNQAVSTLWVLASGILIVLLFDFIMRNLRAYFIDAAGRNLDVQLSKNIFHHLLDTRMGTQTSSVGVIANTVHAFESFREFITSATVTILIDIPFVILFLIVIALLGGWIVLIPIIAIPFILFFGMIVQAPLNAMINKSYRHSSEKQAIMVESLSSMEAIKGLQAEGFMQKRWENAIVASSRLGVKLRALGTLGINFSYLLQQLAVVALVIAGVYSIVQGTLTVGALIACTILISRALMPITQVAGLLARYHQCKTAINALDKVMQLPIERPIDKSFLYLGSLGGDFEFRNVTFNYPGQSIPAVTDITCKIKPKEKVAIIGATGSGKSTLVKLMMKFYEPSFGNLLIDGHEEHQLDPAEIRHFIAYVPQDATLFQGSIRDNMVFGAAYADDNAILRSAKLSTVDKFVANHPDGFNRHVGERGQYLSGGQRQAVVIARSILLDPPIWIFDELTNSMDDLTTSSLIEELKPAIADKTLILVTHKAMMLNLVDRLIVMDAGKIVADGPKDEVLKQLSEHKIRAAHAQNSR